LKGGKRWVNSPVPKRSGDAQVFVWVVSKNWGTPKWMVKIMENAIKMDDFGEENPPF